MNVEQFLAALGELDIDFFTGVPDSLLRPLADELMRRYGENPRHHIIAANEGNALAIAAGHYLATGKAACVYLQNSGEGNLVNPLASLMSSDVYAIPALLIIGWRGEPGVKDEPQHVYQGKVTESLLDVMDVPHIILRQEMSAEELQAAMAPLVQTLGAGKQVALVVKKGALENPQKTKYENTYKVTREQYVETVARYAENDPIVSTTGKASRELFECRERLGQGHERDFLTVGSMGHTSSIALGIALQKPETRVWCIDGDGAALMHLGSLAVIGKSHPQNLVHIVINNGAHESVGGLPTAAFYANLAEIAKACGYDTSVCVCDMDAFCAALEKARAKKGLHFIEARSAIGARAELGRPTATPLENKEKFMEYLRRSE